jgi:hypothetical protein
MEFVEASKNVRSYLHKLGKYISISSASPQRVNDEVVVYTVKIGKFKFTDTELGVLDQDVGIFLRLEKAINERGYVYCCGFAGSAASIEALVSYAPIKSPLRDLDYYPDQNYWYTEASLEKILKNPYVVDHYLEIDDSWFTLYGKLNRDCDTAAINKFIFCVIRNIPGFELLADRKLTATQKEQIILARVGQGQYRTDLLKKWGNQCSVLGIQVCEILRASHIKPWKISTSKERLDPQNGLLLTAHLDALFDRYLISFDDDGNLLVNENIAEQLKEIIAPGMRMRSGLTLLTANLKKYLKHHRREFEKKKLVVLG